MDFKDYAILRLSRSGITVDENSADFVLVRSKSHISVIVNEESKLFQCIGTNECFWLALSSEIRVWLAKHNTKSIPIETRGKRFYELPEDLPNLNFTSIPENYFTEYECTRWLENRQ